MKQHTRRIVTGSVTAIALLLFLAACGGKETVASKSAEAFREAQQKGTPIGGESHGGHSAGGVDDDGATTDSAGDHATMTGMDHSTMTGMDHSTMTARGGMAGVDHSKMKQGQSMAGMDHSKMKQGQSMAAMDHSKMQQGQPMAGMDHSKMQQGQSMAGMDHSKMQQGQQPIAAMDHSKTQQGQPMAGMDHGNMPGIQRGTGAAGSVVMNAPTTSGEMQRVHPATTLRTDNFDAPVPISVSEAMKATEAGGHEDHEKRGITPGQDQENPPTPAPATRDIPNQGNTPAQVIDHSQHGAAAPTTTPRTQSPAPTTPPAAPATSADYTCPMHPEVTSDKPGTCPKCGMTMVKKN